MIDPCAPIIDFYPEDFKIDLNGKKYAWQGVALLPFVDEVRLKAALVSKQNLLTPDEIRRNIRGDDRLYVREGHGGYNMLRTIYTDHFEENTEIQLDGKMFQGMRGRVLHSKDCVPTDGTFDTPVKGLKPVEAVRTLCVRYRDPGYPQDFIFPAKRLPGAVDPPNVLRPEDLLDRGANYQPRHGFGQRRDRAQLDQAGHRMLNHYHNRNNQGGAAFAAIPPPPQYGFTMGSQNERTYDNRRGGGHYGRGGHRDGYDNHRGGDYRHSNRGHHHGGHGHGNHYQGGGRGGGYSNRGQYGGHGNHHQGNNHYQRGGRGGGGYSTRGHYEQNNQQRQNSGGGYYTSNYRRNN